MILLTDLRTLSDQEPKPIAAPVSATDWAEIEPLDAPKGIGALPPNRPRTPSLTLPPRPGAAPPPGLPSRRLGTGAAAGAALGMLWIALWQPAADAGSIYKSVGPDGKVTYSASPPTDSGQRVEQIEIRQEGTVANPPAPIETEPPPPQPSPKAIAAAQQALIRAKAALEQAKIQSAEDWQEQPGGERVLSAAYFRRIAQAETEVVSAERALQQARAGR